MDDIEKFISKIDSDINLLSRFIHDSILQDKSSKAFKYYKKIESKINTAINITTRKIDESRYFEIDLIERRENLYKKKDTLYKKVIPYYEEPDLTNEEVTLYKNKKHFLEGVRYFIYNTKTNEFVGDIAFLGKDYPSRHKYGNISYGIEKEHRGNHYALKALKLLTDDLYKKGIKKIYIAAFSDNIPSIKTIKSFGGVEFPSTDEKISVFKCDLNLIKNNKSKR